MTQRAVVFRNVGIIDPRSIRTFGISAKAVSNPIGYFGTGLKYAIAIIMREGGELDMYADGEHFHFHVKTIEQRGKQFDIIMMNDVELPFTTELGKNWEPWQAFRELYCNALDEGGTAEMVDKFVLEGCGLNETVFTVRGAGFEESFLKRNEIVLKLPNHMRVHQGDVDIYDQQSSFIYYRGIRVHTLETPSVFTYNIQVDAELTEDRTLKNPSAGLGKFPVQIAMMKNREAIRKALLSLGLEKDFLYYSLSWMQYIVTDEFHEELGALFRSNDERLNKDAAGYEAKRVKASTGKHYEEEPLTKVEAKQLKRAVDFAKHVFPNFDDYPIKVVADLGEATMAIADQQTKTMVLSKRSFRFGTKYVASTLIEEYAHLKTGFNDCTRELQTFLFDTICTLIENQTEEPL